MTGAVHLTRDVSSVMSCPDWCARHLDVDLGDRHHVGRDHRVHVGGLTLVGRLDRLDVGGQVGTVEVSLTRVTGGRHVELLSDPLTVAGVEALARMLLGLAAQAHSQRPEQAVECADCSHLFDRDSSPHDDRCWSCAERVDAEAAR